MSFYLPRAQTFSELSVLKPTLDVKKDGASSDANA
jgi:hypothetical protein